MRKRISFILPVFLLLSVSPHFSFSQVSGDYRSNVNPSGNWNTSASWQTYNGSTWVAATDYPGQNAGAGTVTILNSDAISLNVSPANAIGALTIGEGTSGSLTTNNNTVRTLTVSNNLTATVNGSFELRATALTVGGITTINGNITDNNDNGSAIFVGQVTVNNGGSISTSNDSPFTFRGGINNDGTFSLAGAGAIAFNTGNQVIGGSQAITFGGIVTVTGFTLTNESGDLNLTNTSNNSITGTGTWEQGVNRILKFSGGSMNISNVDFDASGNTVDYTRGGNQTVRSATYNNLTISTSGIKTLGGAVTVNGNLAVTTTSTTTLACDIYQITGNASGTFTMASGTTMTLGNTGNSANVIFPTNFTNGNTTLNSASTVTYQNNSTQTVSSIPAYGILTIAQGGTKTINGNTTVGGNLTINAGTFDLGTTATTLSVTGSATVAGTLSFNGTTTKVVTITGDLSGGGTINMSGGSLLHTLNLGGANNAITTFTTAAVASVVNYSRSGDQQIFGSVNYRSLTTSGSGTKTLQQAVTVNNSLTVGNGTIVDPAGRNLTVSGSSTVAGTITDGNTGGANSFQDVDLSGGTLGGSITDLFDINGNLTMPSGNGTIGRATLTVDGTTTVATGRSFTINDDTGVKTFTGSITINGTGTWTSTAVTTTANLVIQGGITNNNTTAGSFSAGGATFNVAQTIAGAGPISFANAVTISGAIIITNQNTAGVTFNNTVNGSAGGSTWKNDDNAITYYQPSAVSTRPMNTGTLDVTDNGNYFYYSRGGDQDIKAPSSSYYHLYITGGSGIKSIIGATNVGGNLYIAPSTTLDPVGQNLTVTGTSTIAGTFAESNAGGTDNLGDVDLSGGTINCSVTDVINIGGNLTMPTGNGIIGNATLTVTGTTTVATGRSLTLNNDNGVKRFNSGITISGTGSWTSTAVVTAGNLDLRGGIDVSSSSGSFSAGVATFNATQNITGAGPLTFANAVSINGAYTITNTNTNGVTFNNTVDGTSASATWKNGANGVTYYKPGAATPPMNTNGVLDMSATGNYFHYSRAGAQTVKVPASSYYHLYITGASSSIKTLAGTISTSGNLQIAASTALDISTYGISVGGTTNIDGTFTDASNLGTNTFTGMITVSGTGSLSTSFNSPFVFEGGITNNGTFSKTGTGAVSFNTNNQDIDGLNPITLAGDATIAAGKTVTYKSTNATGITLSGILNGANTSSTYKNDVNTITNYNPGVSTRPMDTGILDVSASGNIFRYTSSGAQTLKPAATAYNDLTISGAATKILSGNITVNGTFTLSSTTLDVDNLNNYSITVKGNWINTSSTFYAQSGTVTFSGTSDQQITSNGQNFYNLVIDNHATQVSLNDNLTVSNTLTLTDGVVTTGASYRVIVSSSSASALTAFSSGSFINGNLRRNIASNTNTYSFPVGNGTGVTNYYLADMINNNLTGITYIDSKFKPLAGHDDIEMNVFDAWYYGSIVYSSVNTTGVWELEPNIQPGGGSYNIKLYTANMSGLVDNEFAPLKRPIGSTSGADWTTGGGTLNNNDAPGRLAADGYMQRNGLTSFSEFGGGEGSGSGGGLPIELVSFRADPQSDIVSITWTTATETNNDYFTIERSENGESFEDLAVVAGAGNSSEFKTYKLNDWSPLSGISYYRLKQTDFDGNFTQSDVVSVEMNDGDANFSVYPNPVVGRTIMVSTKKSTCRGECVLKLTDLNGNYLELGSAELSDRRTLMVQLPDNLRTGMYFVNLDSGSKNYYQKIMIK